MQRRFLFFGCLILGLAFIVWHLAIPGQTRAAWRMKSDDELLRGYSFPYENKADILIPLQTVEYEHWDSYTFQKGIIWQPLASRLVTSRVSHKPLDRWVGRVLDSRVSQPFSGDEIVYRPLANGWYLYYRESRLAYLH